MAGLPARPPAAARSHLIRADELNRANAAALAAARAATVAEARTVMSSIAHCNDVFVTASGKREERAIGWLTNTLLAGVQ